MKNIIAIKLLVMLITCSAFAQTIRIADNNVVRPTGANVYATLQAAVDAAQPDDIVYITPTTVSYGDVTISKRIILQGVGHNVGLGDRYSPVGAINLVSSADGVNSVSGLILREFYCGAINFTNTGIGSPIFDNIMIEKINSNPDINGPSSKTINNLIIRDCSINRISLSNGGSITNAKIYNNLIKAINISGTTTILNNVISNNIILGYNGTGDINVNTSGAVNNTLIVNNIISTPTWPAFAYLDGVICNNNIFYGATPGTSSAGNYFRNNNFSNNIVTSVATMPPTGTSGGTNSGVGNLVGVSPNFVSVAGTSHEVIYDYSLNPGSPAKNAGTDGTDIGPTGGAYPISKNILFWPAALPLITEFNTSGVIPQNQPLKVNLKAKSN